MICSKCKGKLKVIDSASAKNETYRKRICLYCGNITYSREAIDKSAMYELNRLRGQRK